MPKANVVAPPAEVNGAKALDYVEEILRREAVMGEVERVAVTLWIAHTYVYDSFTLTPRLFVTSADPGCGKSTLLGIVRDLAKNGKMLKRVTVAYISRIGEKQAPTLILDQLDNSICQYKTGELIDTLCGGGERGSKYGLTELVTDGKGKEKRKAIELDCFYPIALGKIGNLPDRALNDRCITIRMHPVTEEEDRRLWELAKGKGDPEAGKMLDAWTRKLPDLGASRPEMPAGFKGRTRDKWHPLFAIADAAGEEWPERARAAAVELEDPDAAGEPAHVKRLRSVVGVLEGWPYREIFSEELKGLLAKGNIELETGGGALLPKVGLKSKTVRRGDRVGKGFKLADVQEAAARYRVTGVTGASEMRDAA